MFKTHRQDIDSKTLQMWLFHKKTPLGSSVLVDLQVSLFSEISQNKVMNLLIWEILPQVNQS